MRDTVYILTLLFFALAIPAQAQVTAVMQAKVEIISGSRVSNMQEGALDLSEANLSDQIQAGHFSLQTDPDTEVTVSVYKMSEILNEDGLPLEFSFLSINHINSFDGNHDITIQGLLKSLPKEKSSYSGKLVTVIEYL
jgi:hypothetical protein